jgi:hypothetical protein
MKFGLHATATESSRGIFGKETETPTHGICQETEQTRTKTTVKPKTQTITTKT